MQNIEAECFNASASRTVYLGRLAAAVRSAARRGVNSSENPLADGKTSPSLLVSNCNAQDKGQAEVPESAEKFCSSATLRHCVEHMEKLQSSDSSNSSQIIICLQKLEHFAVTADLLKNEDIGKRVKAFAKNRDQSVANLARRVVNLWKDQLLKQWFHCSNLLHDFDLKVDECCWLLHSCSLIKCDEFIFTCLAAIMRLSFWPDLYSNLLQSKTAALGQLL